jgi:hypothetical protein
VNQGRKNGSYNLEMTKYYLCIRLHFLNNCAMSIIIVHQVVEECWRCAPGLGFAQAPAWFVLVKVPVGEWLLQQRAVVLAHG